MNINRITESIRPIAIGIWNAEPIELFTAAVVVPATIAAVNSSIWILGWIGPAIVLLGVVVGVLYLLVGIAKTLCLWRDRSG
jgi:hypothetical protein